MSLCYPQPGGLACSKMSWVLWLGVEGEGLTVWAVEGPAVRGEVVHLGDGWVWALTAEGVG